MVERLLTTSDIVVRKEISAPIQAAQGLACW